MLSSSRAGDDGYLETAKPLILQHLDNISDALFIPYAGVTLDWDDYTDKVQAALPELNIRGIHSELNPRQALLQTEAILVGGGNTFHLLNALYEEELVSLIRQRVRAGIPYVGWSAGSNICGQSIRTTNDMPIIEPPTFDALGLVPFQINPHYTDYQPPGHNGETRDERIAEFCALCPETPVVGLREGSGLMCTEGKLRLVGGLAAVVFEEGEKLAIAPDQDLTRLL